MYEEAQISLLCYSIAQKANKIKYVTCLNFVIQSSKANNSL